MTEEKAISTQTVFLLVKRTQSRKVHTDQEIFAVCLTESEAWQIVHAWAEQDPQRFSVVPVVAKGNLADLISVASGQDSIPGLNPGLTAGNQWDRSSEDYSNRPKTGWVSRIRFGY